MNKLLTNGLNCIMIKSVEERFFGQIRRKEKPICPDMPEWLTELFSRLSQVFSKLLIKLGLKIIF